MQILDPRKRQVLEEWERRQQVLRDPVLWARVCGFEPAFHHRFLLNELRKVETRETKRLAIFMPPGSAKSSYSSVLFPPHFIAQKRGLNILACSHTTDLAESFGRRCRNLVVEQTKHLGYSLAEHSKAAGRWETTSNGGYLAAGVGVGIAGYRADCGLIDDPIKNKEDAESKLIRDKHWDWYLFDFKPRLKPDAAIVLIQTRWHEDDLAGRILNSSEAPDWKVIRLPFYAEADDPLGRQPGEILWPEWFKPDMFPTDPRVASSLYQNNPTPEAGNFFAAENLITYKPGELPTNLRNYAASDHAVSLKEEADSTLLVPFGLDDRDNIWIYPDFFWEKATTDVVINEMFSIVKKHRPVTWFAGKDHITGALGPFINKRMEETHTYFTIQESVAKKDKPSRCQSIKGRINQKKVFFPGFHPRWHAVRHELLAFDKGTHDEWPDVLGEIGRGLGDLAPASKVVAKPNEIKDLLDNSNFRPTMTWLKSLCKPQFSNRYADR